MKHFNDKPMTTKRNDPALIWWGIIYSIYNITYVTVLTWYYYTYTCSINQITKTQNT